MNKNIIHDFISTFFNVLGEKIIDCNISDEKVTGSVVGIDEQDEQEDDEPQNFSWIIELDEKILSKITLLCIYLIKNNLVHGDKIIISESELKNKLIELGWSQEETGKFIEHLFNIEIKMIDDGEETDSFFLHF